MIELNSANEDADDDSDEDDDGERDVYGLPC